MKLPPAVHESIRKEAENSKGRADIEGFIARGYLDLLEDARAMSLVTTLHLHIDQRPGKQISVQDPQLELLVYADLNEGGLARAIEKCAAMIKAKARG